MVREEGTVIRVGDGRAIVAVMQSSACQSCKAKQGCGQAVLSDWSGDNDRQAAKNHFSIPAADLELKAGDRVVLGIAEDTLARTAMWIYLWPLAAAFVALVLGAALNAPEPLQLLMALVGGGLAFGLTRGRFSTVTPRWVPEILEVSSQPGGLIARDR